MIKVVCKYKLKPDVKVEYLRLAKDLISESRKEKGCIYYSIYEEINEPLILTMLEEWEDEASLTAHNNSEHIKRIGPELAKLRESRELNIYKELNL